MRRSRPRRRTGSRWDPDTSDKWWLLVAVHLGAIPLLFALALVGRGVVLLVGQGSAGFVRTLLLLALYVMLFVAGPVGVFFDKKYVRSVSGWTPTRWYYLMFFVPFSWVMAADYLWRRHRHVGTP
ncbi:hypothetical protein [Halorussus halophilus]|uniref:hypothetical protein n=1 Tax=Halorussus halophilus TaxID=2650975 RepID=UPI0013012CEF|nr:hypothetical protein [Halorussus halophilus]